MSNQGDYENSRRLAYEAIEFDLRHMETTTQGFEYELHMYSRISGALSLARRACLIEEGEKRAFEARLEMAGRARREEAEI